MFNSRLQKADDVVDEKIYFLQDFILYVCKIIFSNSGK